MLKVSIIVAVYTLLHGHPHVKALQRFESETSFPASDHDECMAALAVKQKDLAKEARQRYGKAAKIIVDSECHPSDLVPS